MNSTKYKILAVDDQEDVLGILKAAIEEGLDCEVELAANGYHGLNQLNRGSFDLVITDINMPLMNGYEFIEASRQNKLFKNPIIVLSSESIDLTKLEGMDVLIAKKPFEVEEVVRRCRTVLGLVGV